MSVNVCETRVHHPSLRLFCLTFAALWMVWLSGCQPASNSSGSFTVSADAGLPQLDPPAQGGDGQWLFWRGPNGDGVVPNQNPPTAWSAQQNVVWKSKVPGRGHASPIVVDKQVLLATANERDKTQSVVSFDLDTGNQKWATQVNSGGFNTRIHGNNTHASPTMCSDGERLFVVFNNHDSAQLSALDLQGNILWQQKAGVFVPKRYHFGYGSSPMIYRDNVVVASECEREGTLAAFNRQTGGRAWSVRRDRATSYSTPVVAHIRGRDEMLLSGGNQVAAYDPTSGLLLWSVPGPWQVTCGTIVWDGDMVFASGGYPFGATLGVSAADHEVIWQNSVKCYEQSLLSHNGYVYGLSDRGILYCWRGSDGEEMWKERLSAPVSASPVLAGGHIYISVQSGTTYVFKPDPDGYEPVAENQLGQSAFATPTFVNNRILARIGMRDGGYQEWLYCLGE